MYFCVFVIYIRERRSVEQHYGDGVTGNSNIVDCYSNSIKK